jgi:hypothetical protein
MKCEYCEQDLRISNAKMESSLETTTVTCVQKLVCVNPDCEIYAGKDLTNPLQIAKTIKTEV